MSKKTDKPILWLTARIARFSYSSFPAFFASALLLPLFVAKSQMYFILSLNSDDARLGKGMPTSTTDRANSSEKFNPSESLPPTTANNSAPLPWLYVEKWAELLTQRSQTTHVPWSYMLHCSHEARIRRGQHSSARKTTIDMSMASKETNLRIRT